MTNNEWTILEERWRELASQTILDHTVYDEIFREIKRKFSYGSSVKRVYHSHTKLMQMLQLAEHHQNPAVNMRIVQYAIWFSMLDATLFASKNLTPNYKLAHKFLSRLGISEIDINHVRNCIDALATPADTITPEMALFLDIYNMDLATDPQNYLDCVAAIKQELSFTERFGFKTKYKTWVRDVMMTTPSIFKTDLLRNQHEAQAQTNLAWAY
jgi:predicted metal-dependent HD superfamily phosphohydrolase